MEEKINILLNKAFQKFLKLAKCARENQAYGEPDKDDFCLVTRLKAVIFALKTIPNELTYDQFRELEKIVNEIGGRDNLPFKNTVPLVVQPAIINYECNNIQEQMENIWIIVNYELPTLTLQSLDINPGKYEVGHGNYLSDIQWLANKKPLTVITIDVPHDPDFTTVNLAGIVEEVNLNMGIAMPVLLTIHGFYNDKQAFKGQHLLAEAKLKFETVWPCYWGKGPGNAIDNPQTRNAFIRSLTKELCCVSCVEADLGEGEYLWYFYAFTNMAKQFWTENGAISGSYKGTLDNFQTQSMVDNLIAGGVTYGIIRFDETGIGQLLVCVKDMPYVDVEILQPQIPVVVPPVTTPDVIVYESFWIGLICSKIIE